MIHVIATDNAIETTSNDEVNVVAGSVGTLGVRVVFTHEIWEQLHVTAVFKAGGCEVAVIVPEDAIKNEQEVLLTVPHEVLRKAGVPLWFGMFGVDADGECVMPTAYVCLAEHILSGVTQSAVGSTAPTPSVYEQWVADVVESAQEARAGAALVQGAATQAVAQIEAAAQEQTQALADIASKNAYIGENEHWYVWNAQEEVYEDSGVSSRGVKGADGAQGERGEKGETGGLLVRGRYETIAALTQAQPSPAVGDTYAVGTVQVNTLYVWNGSDWDNLGSLQGAQGAQGAKGEKGDKGDPGEDGADGAQGAQGEKGNKGDPGEAGADGAQGAKGEKGDKGDPGKAGADGADGAQGEKGDKGDPGETGADGAQGEKGDKGDPGEAGADGAQGAQGEKGDKGDPGEDGADGAAAFAPYTHIASNNVHYLQGEGETGVFVATDVFRGEQFVINNLLTIVTTPDGRPLADGAFVAGQSVLFYCAGDGTATFFVTSERVAYAEIAKKGDDLGFEIGSVVLSSDNGVVLTHGTTVYKIGASNARFAYTIDSPTETEKSLGTPSYPFATAYLDAAATISSDERLKHAIETMPDGFADAMLSVAPRMYRLNKDAANQHLGFIAQEVAAAFAEQSLVIDELAAVRQDAETGMYALMYEEFIPILLLICQRQQRAIDALQAQVDAM